MHPNYMMKTNTSHDVALIKLKLFTMFEKYIGAKFEQRKTEVGNSNNKINMPST